MEGAVRDARRLQQQTPLSMMEVCVIERRAIRARDHQALIAPQAAQFPELQLLRISAASGTMRRAFSVFSSLNCRS
jgi:hypothetical protein